MSATFDDFQASLLVTSYAVLQFIATLILGRLSDVMGRKPLLLISLFGTYVYNLHVCLSAILLECLTTRHSNAGDRVYCGRCGGGITQIFGWSH